MNDKDGVARRKLAALCPRCETPHHFVEVRFPNANDEGFWDVACRGCQENFVIALSNPRESYGTFNKGIRRRVEAAYDGPLEHVANEIAEYDGDLNVNAWRFDYAAPALSLRQVGG